MFFCFPLTNNHMSSSFKPHVLKLQPIVFSCPKSVTNQFIGGNPVTETQIISDMLPNISDMSNYRSRNSIPFINLSEKKTKQEAVSYIYHPFSHPSVLAGLGIARIGTLFGGEEHPIIGMLRVPRHGASQGPVIGCQPWMNKPRLRLFFIGKVP